MKLLFDQNLSRHLVARLASRYPDVVERFVASEDEALLVLPGLGL